MEHLDPYLEELYFRSIMSVVDVEDVDGRQIVSVLIGQWNPNQKVSFPLDIIPKEIQVGITPNSFLIAYVNLDVETKEELQFKDFELPDVEVSRYKNRFNV